jgi:hypothetical protein
VPFIRGCGWFGFLICLGVVNESLHYLELEWEQPCQKDTLNTSLTQGYAASLHPEAEKTIRTSYDKASLR